ncbi:IS66 family insertion sequence element accessory protein TnpB [Burkholderia seminalis]|uniref:IS66 family insertion sequence element accessory protein TnpB n=1 Tax=Burkholderia seminalis TaxID=488731 RepID=UPI0034648AD0
MTAGYVYWRSGSKKGRFAWPRADSGVVALTTAQLSLLLEGFDWVRRETVKR